jgi:hypothetical protein
MSDYRTLPFRPPSLRKKRLTDDDYCCYCHRLFALGTIRRMVHLINDGRALLHPKDEDNYASDEGDALWFPICAVCAKDIGSQWTVLLEHP